MLIRVIAVSLLAMPFAAVGFSGEGDDLGTGNRFPRSAGNTAGHGRQSVRDL